MEINKRDKRICPATGVSFHPKRDNQIYISRAAQIKYNNDLSTFRRNEMKLFIDSIKSNQDKLSKLYDYIKRNNLKNISADFIKYEGIDFGAFSSITKNIITDGNVYWSISYGFESVDSELNFYYIHKKNSK